MGICHLILYMTSYNVTLAGIQPAELRRSGVTLSLGRCAMEPGHLLHSAHTFLSSANAWCLKSRHLCPPHSNSSVFLTTTTYVQRNGMWSEQTIPQDSAFNFRHQYPPSQNYPPKNSLDLAQPPPHRCRMFLLLLVQMRYGLLCVLWVWHRRTNRWPCCPPMSNPSTSPWTARPEGSGQWDNWTAAHHLPQNLAWPSSG